jgi:membrane-bound lytic murein transglycosylase B
MAAADSPERLPITLATLPMTPDRLDWVRKTLRERSDWAYKELKALLTYSKAYAFDPLAMPGSVYGAIGICQFMPSNVPRFAVDGNRDGKVDLFDPEDAIPSVGNYLKAHGWGVSPLDARHTALKRYNNSTRYANTILALAENITPPPAAGAKTGTPAVAGKKEGKSSTAKPGTTVKKKPARARL